MKADLESLSDAEIEKIERLVEMLDTSSFGFLTLEMERFRLTIGKGDSGLGGEAAPRQLPAVSATPEPAGPQPASDEPPAAAAPTPEAMAVEGAVDVLAPTMGSFYARPEPSAPPFVTVGSEVEAGATVGLIEVMKLYNGVQAGVDGVVAQICVEDAAFVEYGQVLMRIVPKKT